ncbi:MAG: alpha-D-glucose phosphate-specific phosphoglucomutase [Rhodobacterales bacterium]|nr:MAG: alpha-D-glucose phosphate-specific phosphoglucomutase [Rhodobacterales bacterium]
MQIQTRPLTPFDGQKPGTSGLRKKTRVFMQEGYLEAFVQSVFDAIGGVSGKTLVLGGDGRFFNDRAVQVILKMAAGQGATKMIVGAGGILSTPAASHLIRKRGTDGGLILSASHNPGGEDEDFGIKFNGANGGPAPEALTDAIYARTQEVDGYVTALADDVDLSAQGETRIGDTVVEIVDPVADYADLLETLFDFDAIRAMIEGGFRLRIDSMHAVTGPYAREIFERRLGAPEGTVINAVPLPDFGGGHPDPNPTWAKDLMDEMMSEAAPDFGAASDGDGDRNMIVGRGVYVSPSDSLAVLAANLHLAPAYKDGIGGVARSMPTSRAVDAVAQARGLDCFKTPTGWKFFGNLLDAGRIRLCGEESFGTGSDHVREKDGIWAMLAWLNILAVTGKGVDDLLRAHWDEFGRTFYSRHDYEALDSAAANDLMADLRGRLGALAGQSFAGRAVSHAREFDYLDPVDGSQSSGQGVRVFFEGGGRAVFRLSGTGTSGATLRVYLEDQAEDAGLEAQEALSSVIAAVAELTGIAERTGRTGPDVIT